MGIKGESGGREVGGRERERGQGERDRAEQLVNSFKRKVFKLQDKCILFSLEHSLSMQAIFSFVAHKQHAKRRLTRLASPTHLCEKE